MSDCGIIEVIEGSKEVVEVYKCQTWQVSMTGPVDSVFGRIGIVAAEAGDYQLNQITGLTDAGLGNMFLADDGTYKSVVGGVSSVFGRVGDVVAEDDDYALAQINGLTDAGLGTLFLADDGTYKAPPSSPPGGPDTSIQFNDGGAFGGSVDLTWDGTSLITQNAVGIGAAPTSKLHIQGLTGGFSGGILQQVYFEGTLPVLNFKDTDGTANSNHFQISTVDGFALNFRGLNDGGGVNADDILVLHGINGNVGMGLSDPLYPLHVSATNPNVAMFQTTQTSGAVFIWAGSSVNGFQLDSGKLSVINSSGIDTATFNQNNRRTGFNNTDPDGITHSVAFNATDIVQVVQATTLQTANLSEWWDDLDTVILAVNPDGNINTVENRDLELQRAGITRFIVGSSYLTTANSGTGSMAINYNPSVAAPLYSFRGDTDTGIVWGGADKIEFVAGGEEILSVIEGGVNIVGVGGNPNGKNTRLSIGSDSGLEKVIRFETAGSLQWVIGCDNTGAVDANDFQIAATEGSPFIVLDRSELRMGIGTNTPLGLVHVHTGDSGGTPAANYDDFIVESDNHAGISILTPSNKFGGIMFGDEVTGDVGRITYEHTTNEIDFWTSSTKWLVLNSGGQLRLSESDSLLQEILLDPDNSNHSYIAVETNNLVRNAGIQFTNNQDGNTWGIAHEYTTNDLVIGNARVANTGFVNNGIVFVDELGKVGVNIAPDATLDTVIADPTHTGTVVQAAPLQVANLAEWQDDLGLPLVVITSDGSLIAPSITTGAFTILNTNPAVAALTVIGAPAQTEDLVEYQNDLGTVLSRVSNDGRFLAPNGNATTPGFAFSGLENTGFYRNGTNVRVSVGGAWDWEFGPDVFQGVSSRGPQIRSEVASATNPVYCFIDDDDTGIGSASTGRINFVNNGVQSGYFDSDNSLIIENDTVNLFKIRAASDPNQRMLFAPNGSGHSTILIQSNTASRDIGITLDDNINALTWAVHTATNTSDFFISPRSAGAGVGGWAASAVGVRKDADGRMVGIGGVEPNSEQLRVVSRDATYKCIVLETAPLQTARAFELRNDVDASLMDIDAAGQLTLDVSQSFGTTTGLMFGDGDTGFYEASDDNLRVRTAGSDRGYWTSGGYFSEVSGGPGVLNEAASATNPSLIPNRSDLDTGIGSAGANFVSLISGGVEGFRVADNRDVAFGLSGGATVLTAGFYFDESVPRARINSDQECLQLIGVTDSLQSIVFRPSNSGQCYGRLTTNTATREAMIGYKQNVSGIEWAVGLATGDDFFIAETPVGSGTTSWLDSQIGIRNTNGMVGIGGIEPTDEQVLIATGDATYKGLVVRQAAIHTENTIEVQDDLSATLFAINADGGLVVDAAESFGFDNGIIFGDGDTGIYQQADDVIRIRTIGDDRWVISNSELRSNSSGGGYLGRAAASATLPALAFTSEPSTGIGKAAAGQLSLISESTEAERKTADTVSTTDATATIVEAFVTATDAAYEITARVVGRNTTNSSEICSFNITGTFKNDGGVLTQVGLTTTNHFARDVGSWDVVFNLNGTSVEVEVTGAAATNIDWKCSLSILTV